MKFNFYESKALGDEHRIMYDVALGENTNIVGMILASVSKEYHNVCVLAYSAEKKDVKAIFKEFLEIQGMPLYFKYEEHDAEKNQMLESLGAALIRDSDKVTIWWKEENKWIWRLG